MSNIQIVVGANRELIDSEAVNPVNITYVLKDIKDYSSRKTSFSKTISIVQTPQTDRIFKSAFNINSVDFDSKKKIFAEVLDGGVSILRGYLQLTAVLHNTYNVIVAADNINIIQDLGDDLISGNTDTSADVKFTDSSDLYSHVLNYSTLRTLMASDYTPTGRGIIYPVIDYDDTMKDVSGLSGTNYRILPAIFAKQLFDKIVSDSGYSYTASDMIIDILKRLVIPYNKDYKNLCVDYSPQRIRFGNISTTESYPTVNDSGNIPKGALYDMHTDVRDKNELYEYTVDSNNAPILLPTYDCAFKPIVTLKMKNRYTESTTVNATVSLCYINPEGTLSSTELGTVALSNNYLTFSTNQTSDTVANSFSWESIDTKFGGVAWIHVETDNSDENRKYAVTVDSLSSFVDYYIVNYLYSGMKTITYNDCLPASYKKADFIKDILIMFDAFVDIDPIDNKKLIIKTYNDYYNTGKVVDWSNKIDVSTISFQELSATMNNTYKVGYSDGDDIYNTSYSDANELGLATTKVYNKDDFSDGDDESSLSIPATPVRYLTNEIDIACPVKESGTFDSDQSPRILFYNHNLSVGYQITIGGRVKYPVEAIIYLPTCTMKKICGADGISDVSNINLAFDSRKSFIDRTTECNRNLYNLFYQNDLESAMYGREKLLTAKFNITSDDVSQLQLNDKIYIASKVMGDAYYRINKITSFQGDGTQTQCELIKLDLAYKPTYSNPIPHEVATL